MDESKFNLWRACFSFCFVDGFLAPEELQWIESKLETLAFSESQKTLLMLDLKSPPDIASLLPLITKPADKGFLINQIRVLSTFDNEISDIERVKIKDLCQAVLSKIDLVEMNATIAADEKESYHEDEVFKVHNKHSYVETLVKGLMRFLNPGDYKFPK